LDWSHKMQRQMASAASTSSVVRGMGESIQVWMSQVRRIFHSE
jgi:hypothetical protein